MQLFAGVARGTRADGDGRPPSRPSPRSAWSRPSPRSARPISLSDLGPAQLARWRELAARAAEPNPFFEPEFVLPAARHLRPRDVGLVVVENRERDWVACMPVWPWLRRGKVRAPVLTSWGHPWYGCLGTPLVAQDVLADGAERLLVRALEASRTLKVVPGVVALTLVGEGGPVAIALSHAEVSRAHLLTRHGLFDRAVLRRSTVDAGPVLSGRHRRDLRRHERRLGEALGGSPVVTDESSRAGAVEEFMAVEASGWKGDRGDALRVRAAHAQFFRELCDGFRAAGRLQLLAYGVPGRTASYKCNLLTPAGVFCFRIAFDESVGRFRPGLQLELRMIDWFAERMDQSWLDSCAAPGHPMFDRLWPDRRRLASHLVASGGAVGYGASLAADLYRFTRDAVVA